ncbi:hypothetical protein L208DRAFT_1376783 [Tricholoma matsutake]|nr:hypothetical protein L208DRAFT_1376783 [Tricholoma matsutake 945]
MLGAQLTSTISPDLSCAQRADGTLKDASEIEWHYDKDDDSPMATTALSCCSGHTSRPSAHAVDQNNAMNIRPSLPSRSAPTGTKRMASPCDSDSEVTDILSDDFDKLQAIADADHEASTVRSHQDLTANIQTIFEWEKEHKDPNTGKVQDGHWCKICWENPHVEKKACFLTGSMTSLCMRITHHQDHVKLY